MRVKDIKIGNVYAASRGMQKHGNSRSRTMRVKVVGFRDYDVIDHFRSYNTRKLVTVEFLDEGDSMKSQEDLEPTHIWHPWEDEIEYREKLAEETRSRQKYREDQIASVEVTRKELLELLPKDSKYRILIESLPVLYQAGRFDIGLKFYINDLLEFATDVMEFAVECCVNETD